MIFSIHYYSKVLPKLNGWKGPEQKRCPTSPAFQIKRARGRQDDVHRHPRAIFTADVVFQNLLGGAIIFFNLTVLFGHFFKSPKNCYQSYGCKSLIVFF